MSSFRIKLNNYGELDMTTEALRVLPQAETAEASQNNKELSVKKLVDEIIDKRFEENQFETVEEYIKYQLENSGGITKDPKLYKDSKIHLLGRLEINNMVKSGLNWNHVVTDSATVLDGKITRYEYLPLARQGIRTNLKTSDINEYMKHNACDIVRTKENYVVDRTFRVASPGELDFSSVTAKKVFWYDNGTVDLNRLPTAREGFYGLRAENILGTGTSLAKTAKMKGLGAEVVKELKAREPGVLQRIFSFGGKHSNTSSGN